MLNITLTILPIVLSLSAPDAENDWPRFRGANGSGLGAGHLPSECSAGKNLAWKSSVPLGRSSPIVSRDDLFLTAEEGDERVVMCLSASTGETRWRKSSTKARKEVASGLNGPSTPTPVIERDRLIAFFPDIGLLAYDRGGKELWRTPVGPFKSMHGISSSPILVDGLVVILADQIGDSFLAAYRADTGAPAWRMDRASGLAGGYSTPAVYKPAGGQAQVIASGALEVTGYEAATGKRIWWATGLTNSPVTIPLVDGDTLYLCEPPGEPLPFSMVADSDKDKDGKITMAEAGDPSMIRLFESIDKTAGNGDGAVDKEEWDKAWKTFVGRGGLASLKLGEPGDRSGSVTRLYTKALPYVPSPLLAGGALFVVRDGGVVMTFEPGSGKVLKQGRLKEGTGKYYASPVAGDGKVFLVDEDGKVSVITARPEWEELSAGELGETCIATPAIAGGRLFIRGKKTLFAFAQAEKKA